MCCRHENLPTAPIDWEDRETNCPDCGARMMAVHDDGYDDDTGESHDQHYWLERDGRLSLTT